VALDDVAESRAGRLVDLGFAPLDALHLALAERAGARWLVTCDDRLIKLAARLAGTLGTTVALPPEVAWGKQA